MTLFFAKINWFDDYDEQNKTDKCFIFAKDYADACRQLSEHFNYIDNIKINCINDFVGDTSILYVPNDKNLIQEIKNANIW